MASDADRKEFLRKAGGRLVNPLPKPPKFPEEIFTKPAHERKAGAEKYNKEMEEWAKNLQPAQPETETAEADATGTTPITIVGKRGKQGLPGKDGVTQVITQTVTIPEIDISIAELGLQRIIFLAVRTDGKPGTGKLSDPFNASTADKFDALMRAIPEYSDIVLLPGTFETHGWSASRDATAWRLRRGCRLRGCGMERTTLKLVGCTVSEAYTVILGGYSFDGTNDLFWNTDGTAPYPWCEVGDMTIDCNWQGQSEQNITTNAILLSGSYTRVFGVRVINTGSKLAATECFVIVTGNVADSIDSNGTIHSIIEDCIIEKIQHNSTTGGNMTCLAVFGGNPEGNLGVTHNACVRRNYVDGKFADGTIPYYSASIPAGRLPVQPIGITAGYSVVIEDNHVRNGTVSCYSDTWYSREAIIRGNTFHNVLYGAYTNFNGVSWGSGQKYRIERLRVENNEIYLMVTVGQTPANAGVHGLLFIDFSNAAVPANYQFYEALIRGNRISHVDNDMQATNIVGVGIGVTHAENLILEDNVIRIPNALSTGTGVAKASIYLNKIGRLQARNNRRPEDNSIILPYSVDQAKFLCDQEFEQRKASILRMSRF